MSTRTEKVGEIIKREVSRLIREKINDPRIGFVTITEVEVTPDIKYAKIFFSVLGNQKEKEDTIHGLNSAKKFIRGQLGEFITTKFMPDLEFVYDETVAKANHLLELMHKVKKEEQDK